MEFVECGPFLVNSIARERFHHAKSRLGNGFVLTYADLYMGGLDVTRWKGRKRRSILAFFFLVGTPCNWKTTNDTWLKLVHTKSGKVS